MQKVAQEDRVQVGSVRHSLSAIRKAHVELDKMTSDSNTPTALTSQIQLCEVLLTEISDIRSSLAARLKIQRPRVRVRQHFGLNG